MALNNASSKRNMAPNSNITDKARPISYRLNELINTAHAQSSNQTSQLCHTTQKSQLTTEVSKAFPTRPKRQTSSHVYHDFMERCQEATLVLPEFGTSIPDHFKESMKSQVVRPRTRTIREAELAVSRQEKTVTPRKGPAYGRMNSIFVAPSLEVDNADLPPSNFSENPKVLTGSTQPSRTPRNSNGASGQNTSRSNRSVRSARTQRSTRDSMAEDTATRFDLMEVSCQYDGRFTEEDQIKDFGRPVLPRVPRHTGPLWELFLRYARKDKDPITMKTEREAQEAREQMWAQTKAEPEECPVKRLINQQDLAILCSDLNLLPNRINLGELSVAFKASYRNLADCKSAQPRPPDLCYEEFVECLIRIGLMTYSHPPFDKKFPSSKEKLTAFMSNMDLLNSDTRELKLRLNALERFKKERGKRNLEQKWSYVDSQMKPQLSPAAIAVATGTLDPKLLALIQKNEDTADPAVWREYKEVGIDCGCIQMWPGKSVQRFFRVALRNRHTRLSNFEVNCVNLPFMEATYSERPLACGIPRVLELTCGFTTAGEWLGAIDIRFEKTGNVLSIPVYAKAVWHHNFETYARHKVELGLPLQEPSSQVLHTISC
ncbi:hypothetical protein CYMTET_54124 [Cymbomonas tetramitiformis]|uniref:Uncharacterized protein n=1 Tax=Cymbomonas tetramitiformis TaxID=36881 RepID=A0AAE0BFP1_9CHLO|nr:hypothetical protein CYMTET_54124 [Cymbomonas tetramitiformis]